MLNLDPLFTLIDYQTRRDKSPERWAAEVLRRSSAHLIHL